MPLKQRTQIFQINVTELKIPTGRRQSSWLFTKRDQGFELGATVKQILVAGWRPWARNVRITTPARFTKTLHLRQFLSSLSSPQSSLPSQRCMTGTHWRFPQVNSWDEHMILPGIWQQKCQIYNNTTLKEPGHGILSYFVHVQGRKLENRSLVR